MRRLGWMLATMAVSLHATAQSAEQAPDGAPVTLQPVLDVLPMGRHATLPWDWHPAWALVWALLIAAAVWAALAGWRAVQADPERLRRSGLRLLRRRLAALGDGGATPPSAAELQGWLLASARAWQVPLAAPTAADIAQAVSAQTGDAASAERWRQLCSAVECQLFARDPRMPGDWHARARDAYASIPRPRRRWPWPDRRVHWLPLATAAMLLIGVLPDAARALAQPDASARLAALEDVGPAALAALDADPLDWAARENVARILLARGNVNGALLHGTIAFLQTRSGAASRDNLRVAIAAAASADPRLIALFGDEGLQRLPALLAPAGWQRVALLGMLLLATAAAALLVQLYQPARRRAGVAGAGVGIGAGALLLLAAIVAWSAYGDLRRADVALLLEDVELSPVPTNLVPVDQRIPLAAGSAVRVRDHFLGWSAVTHADGSRGWVRSGLVQPVYRAFEAAPRDAEGS